MIDLEGLEKLAERLRLIVKKYEAKNPLRTADFHGEDCSCYRCAVDACDAAINALPELLAMARRVEGLRPEVLEFARLMEEKLRANDHKPGWKHDDPEELINRIEVETNELRSAVCRAFGEAHWPLQEGDYRPHEFAQYKWRTATKDERAEWSEKIPGEAADVANFAMMVWDVCARTALKEKPQ